MVGDACNPYLHTPQNRKVYFPAPDDVKSRVESKGLGPTKVVCLLRKKLYGERDAAAEFGDVVASVLLNLGFELCPQQPQFYIHRAAEVPAEVHQGDVHVAGPDQS